MTSVLEGKVRAPKEFNILTFYVHHKKQDGVVVLVQKIETLLHEVSEVNIREKDFYAVYNGSKNTRTIIATLHRNKQEDEY